MKYYELFSEWNGGNELYGETLEEAVLRSKTLHRPSTFSTITQETTPGETVTVKRSLGMIDTSGYQRGSRDYDSVLIETTDGRILCVDAKSREVKFL